jgi:hypothetical protein
MGVRSLVKRGLKKALGVDIRRADAPANGAPPPTAPVKVAPPPVAKVAPPPVAKVAPPPVAKVAPPPVAEVAPPPVAEVAPPPVGAPKTEGAKIDKAKIERARKRARKGVLAFVDKQGGTSTLSEMHDHSERRYFFAHKAFSNLMEDMVRDEVINWDADSGIATLTDWGRKEIAD